MSTNQLYDALSEIYAYWLEVHQKQPYSANELIYSETLTTLQREWLSAFIIIWETVETMQQDDATAGTLD